MKPANFEALKKIISTEKKAISELNSSLNHLEFSKDKGEKASIEAHVKRLKDSLKKINMDIAEELTKINLSKPLNAVRKEQPKKENIPKKAKPKKFLLDKKVTKKLSQLEKETIKRLRKKEIKLESKKAEKPKGYTQFANKHFGNLAKKLSKEKNFEILKKDLMKTNLEFTPTNYISMATLTVILSIIGAIILFLFFFLFKIGGEGALISLATENLGIKFLKTFWILLAVPFFTFLFMYFYPSLERKATATRIEQELPFAIIHMSAISGSMIEPSKIFSILVETREYEYLGKEFTKLINEINIYGYDLVSALRSSALNSPSEKLSELFIGLATTINSGGNLSTFFNKRAQTLLFEYKLDREKNTKTAETFMDIYISIVIAAPMILMLLLMMMKISGLGVSLGTTSITLMIILGVSIINIAFLAFLHLRKPIG